MFDKPWLARVLLLHSFLWYSLFYLKNGFYHKVVGHWGPLRENSVKKSV